jgi:hypothetical protein
MGLAFSAGETVCPLCGHRLVFIRPPRPVGKGSAKGGGKQAARKSMGLNFNSRPSKKKKAKKLSDRFLGPKPRKRRPPGRKRATRKDIGRKR